MGHKHNPPDLTKLVTRLCEDMDTAAHNADEAQRKALEATRLAEKAAADVRNVAHTLRAFLAENTTAPLATRSSAG